MTVGLAPSGRRRTCRDDGDGEIAPGFAMRIEQSALGTLIHERDLTPSAEGTPLPQKTLSPARMIGGELDQRPFRRETAERSMSATHFDLGVLRTVTASPIDAPSDSLSSPYQ
jgi:hypothetical protein